jgi:hypothetical protein
MAMPDGIGGNTEDKKPGISLTVVDLGRKRRMPEGIGGSQDSEEEDYEEPISAEQARGDATKEIISVLTSMKPDPRRLDKALYAYIKACSSGNDEGSE